MLLNLSNCSPWDAVCPRHNLDCNLDARVVRPLGGENVGSLETGLALAGELTESVMLQPAPPAQVAAHRSRASRLQLAAPRPTGPAPGSHPG